MHSTTLLIIKVARDCGVFIVGGSIPERQCAKLYNTSMVFSPTGDMIAVHRKMHLFDIDVPGKIRFKGYTWHL